ncbi:MAG: serine/threonine-protein kinase, partial [Gordonia sp. (in: high G+C Gram-positive bacteria)]
MDDGIDRSGATLGDYTLDRLLGRGGMGEVYLATDNRRGREVALKLLPPQYADDALFRERFLRESRTAARINSPHVIPIHDWGEIDGRLFLDMRVVDGQDLRHLLAGGPLPPAAAVGIVAQIAQALDAAHADGLIHRDVKPDNVLVDPNGFVYLVDFGLAQAAGDTRLTETGLAVGSFGYMAPERFGAGDQPGPAADIYALACVLYECLTGRPPFTATHIQALIGAHLTQPPPLLHLPVDAVIARGMAKDPAGRFPTAGTLAAAAAAALGISPAGPPS